MHKDMRGPAARSRAGFDGLRDVTRPCSKKAWDRPRDISGQAARDWGPATLQPSPSCRASIRAPPVCSGVSVALRESINFG